MDSYVMSIFGGPPLHPIVARLEPSTEQEPAIRGRGCDVAVTAGAGAGKTRTLVARYLALLAEGAPLRGVIAITFTEKAAREMRNRVRAAVLDYLESGEASETERLAWEEVYAGLDAARIGTIHALCAEILRAHPAEAAVDPRFDVLDEAQSALLLRQALDETLGVAAEDAAQAALFELLGERGLRGTLETLLHERLDATPIFSAMPEDVLGHWAAALETRQRGALESLDESPEWRRAVETVFGVVAHDLSDLAEQARQIAVSALGDSEPGEPLADRLARLAGLSKIKLTGGRAAAWPGGKGQLDAIKAALKTLRELHKANNLLHLVLTSQDVALAAALPALHACFTYAAVRYAALKRDLNALDFDDLEAGALALLEGDPAVRARWHDETAALLVDEFQDTNARQRRLVELLDGGRGRLFVVGDAKQSIYRFRGADVTVFRDLREEVRRSGGQLLALDTSYRAHRPLMDALNALLCPVLGEADDPARPWVEPFAPLLPSRASPGPGFAAPHVRLQLGLGSKGNGALDRSAAALASELRKMVEGGLQVAEGDSCRLLSYGDIAILCRASTSFAAYEDALETAGIPYLTVSGRGFYDRPEIRDLLNALTALADPADDLALAGLLRSPAFALSDAALYQLCRTRDEADSSVALWDVLRTDGPLLPGEESGRAARAALLIADLHAQAGRAPVAELLKAFLDATGYRAILASAAGQARAARNVAKLLSDAHAGGMVSVSEFLAYVAELRDAGSREGEARADAEGAVQIMSVHAAKGLEFPVVVLGDITYNPPTRNRVLLDPVLGVLLPQKDDAKTLPAIYQLGRVTANDQEDAETARLLYVAATRARERLLINGCITVKMDGTPGKLNGWLGRLEGAGSIGLAGRQVAVPDEAPEPLLLELSVGAEPVDCAIYGPGWRAPDRFEPPMSAMGGEAPIPPPLLAAVLAEPVSADDRSAAQERDPGQRVWRVAPAAARPRAPAWVVGKIVHDALAVWRFPGIDDSFNRWAEARARNYGLTDARQLADAIHRSDRLLQRFAAHPLHAAMNAATRRLHEAPYTLLGDDGGVGRGVERGVLDALYLADGRWTIVEFKTDAIRNAAELEALLAEQDYLAQAERYAFAVERLLGARPDVVLCLLDYAGEVHLPAIVPADGP